MQTARESSRLRRCNKRRNSRKKSLSPSDLKCVRDRTDNRRSLSEGAKLKHRKSNIRRTLTHPLCDGVQDVTMIGVFNREVKVNPVPESDDSIIPPTSSDRDTEDDARVLKSVINRSRWDSGSEMDSLVSTVVRKASARRRRTPANPEWGVSSEGGEASEPEAGRMRPEDYRLVFLSSDSSCRDDTEDSSSTASSAAPAAPDDCDWDYFEPGAAPPPQPIPIQPHVPQTCPRTCSCGAEPRIVAVPVPVPVPVPAALWPALLAFPQTPPTPHWNTYPGFPPLDAAALARLTTAAAVAVTAAATANANAIALTQTKTLEMTERSDKAIQSETTQAPDNDTTDNVIERPETSDIKVIAKQELSVAAEPLDAMPEHLDAEKAFISSNESGDSSDSDAGVERRSYDLTSGAPEEPATTDEDSDDSGGGGAQFSRVFVVNPADSSSDMEDNADSSGIDCDDSYDKKSDNSLEIIAEVIMQNDLNVNREEVSNNQNNENVVLLESVSFNENAPVIPYGSDDENCDSKKSHFMKFCDENMLRSETCEEFNSFNATCSSDYNTLDSKENKDNHTNTSITSSENKKCDTLDNTLNAECDMKVKVSVELPNEKHNNEKLISNETSHGLLAKLAPSPEPTADNSGSASVEKIDLFKGIERTLSELLKKELLLEEQEEEKLHGSRPVCLEAGGAGAPADAVSTVCRARTAATDGSARFTSRVMITHDRVSVVTSDTTRLMRDITVQHTNSVNETARQNENDERTSDDDATQPSGGVTVVSNADTLSAVVCLEEGLADDDSWVEDVSHDEDDGTSPSDSDSGDEATLPTRGEEFAYCRRSLDFTLHTIVEESCEESETEHTTKKSRPISATELEKYFFFGLGDGRNIRDDEEPTSETSSVCSEGGESIVDNEQPERSGDNDELVSSRLEKYFLSGFMGFNQERRDSDGSGSVGSDSEGKQSPEQRRKRLVRARGTPRSHSSSLDNLLTGEEQTQDGQEVSDGSSTEADDRHDSTERLDSQGESKRKKQNKKTRGSPADERRLSTEFAEETRDDTRSVSEGEDGRLTPRPEFPPLGSELSESKKQTSRDSGFVGSCDDLLRNGDTSSDFTRSHESKVELEEIIEEIRPDIEERVEGLPTSRPPPTPLIRKDSFNNWSSDEETNLMMTKMRQFFKQMINSANVRASTPQSSNSESSRPPKPPQLLYFESELTRLMKTVPGIRDEEVREIVEYLSSEDTWSDSYDSSDYAGSDLEGTSANRSALRKQISESCREIIDEFDRGNGEAGSLERDAVGAYQRLAATLGRAGEGSPPLFGKVMRHIGGRLVALMHEVSGGVPSTDDDSASEPGALARSRSHDILEPTASRGSVASDSERFSWRGSFESALLAADSRGTLGGGGCEARRSPAGAELAAQKPHSRSCGAIGGSEDRLWRGRRRASAPDAESEEEQRAGSLPRLPSIAGTAAPAGPVKSARYRAPGFRTATRAASAPGLHAPRRRRPPPATLQPPPAAPASAPSLGSTATMKAKKTKSGVSRGAAFANKDEDVSCWNCLAGEFSDNEDGPVSLIKVRKQNREKLRLYSFLASQVTKPKAVSLKQRVTENYVVVTTIYEELAEDEKLKGQFTENIDQGFKIEPLDLTNSPEHPVIRVIKDYKTTDNTDQESKPSSIHYFEYGNDFDQRLNNLPPEIRCDVLKALSHVINQSNKDACNVQVEESSQSVIVPDHVKVESNVVDQSFNTLAAEKSSVIVKGSDHLKNQNDNIDQSFNTLLDEKSSQAGKALDHVKIQNSNIVQGLSNFLGETSSKGEKTFDHVKLQSCDIGQSFNNLLVEKSTDIVKDSDHLTIKDDDINRSVKKVNHVKKQGINIVQGLSNLFGEKSSESLKASGEGKNSIKNDSTLKVEKSGKSAEKPGHVKIQSDNIAQGLKNHLIEKSSEAIKVPVVKNSSRLFSSYTVVKSSESAKVPDHVKIESDNISEGLNNFLVEKSSEFGKDDPVEIHRKVMIETRSPKIKRAIKEHSVTESSKKADNIEQLNLSNLPELSFLKVVKDLHFVDQENLPVEKSMEYVKAPDHLKMLSKVFVEANSPEVERKINEKDSYKYSSVIESSKMDDDIEHLDVEKSPELSFLKVMKDLHDVHKDSNNSTVESSSESVKAPGHLKILSKVLVETQSSETEWAMKEQDSQTHKIVTEYTNKGADIEPFDLAKRKFSVLKMAKDYKFTDNMNQEVKPESVHTFTYVSPKLIQLSMKDDNKLHVIDQGFNKSIVEKCSEAVKGFDRVKIQNVDHGFRNLSVEKSNESVESPGNVKIFRKVLIETHSPTIKHTIIEHDSHKSESDVKTTKNDDSIASLEMTHSPELPVIKVIKHYKFTDKINQKIEPHTFKQESSVSNKIIQLNMKSDNYLDKTEQDLPIEKSNESVIIHRKVLTEPGSKMKRAIKEHESPKYGNMELTKKDDDIIEELADEIDNATGRNSGRITSSTDKMDNSSYAASDSGCYAESAVTKYNTGESSSPELPHTSEPRNMYFLRQNFKSSLPAIPFEQKNLTTSSTSLTSSPKKINEKYIRWSTLSIHQKPLSFGDESYISESASPGHATLPRRSNSPLPHERELGERFSLNRSGLQTRSESMASVYSGAGEGLRGNVTVKGDVQFSLLYNYRLGALEVGVRRCRDLAPVDTKRNRSDPYVKVYLLPDKSKSGKRKTKVKKNTLNPVFEETLSFVQPLASLSSRTLWLSVWHADMFGRNDFLGEVTLPLADVVFDDAAPMWYKLHERTEQFDEQQGTRGDLIIGLKFEAPEGGPRARGTLHVLVKEAKNVVATKPNGLADVFCKSYLLPERGRLAKQKTTVCRRTLNPRWEHTFTYRGLTLQELGTRALELSLWDRDRLASNDFMGAVRLSLGTGTYMGASVNWMDSVGKEQSLWQTMMQRPNFWVEGSLPLRPQLNNC